MEHNKDLSFHLKKEQSGWVSSHNSTIPPSEFNNITSWHSPCHINSPKFLHLWRFKSSVMWHCAVAWAVCDVSSDQTAFILETLKMKTLRSFEMSRTASPVTQRHITKTYIFSTLLWEPHILHPSVLFISSQKKISNVNEWQMAKYIFMTQTGTKVLVEYVNMSICQYVRNDTQGKIPNVEHSVYNKQHTKSYPTVICVKTTTQSQRYSLQTLILLFITYRSLKFLSCYLH